MQLSSKNFRKIHLVDLKLLSSRLLIFLSKIQWCTNLCGARTREVRYLSPVQRQTIIAKFDAGVSVRELADEFERGVQTIRDTIKRWNLH
jgi:hypothetical protein